MVQANLLAGSLAARAGRDPRLAGFAEDGCYGRALPSAAVTGVLEDLADGTGRPPPEATDDEVIGMLGCWQAAEARAHARLLAVLRELVRRRPAGGGTAACPDALPGAWEKGTAHEAAAALGISWQAAESLLGLAADLETRLPATGRLLDEGVLTGLKARIVSEEFTPLDEDKTAGAEALLAGHDLGAASMTPGRLRKLCQRIADTVDPEGARRRREDARRARARVSFFRAHGGDTAMFAEGLPPDDALVAQSGIQERALAYRDAGIFPGEPMDLLRVVALVDLVNQVTVEERAARCRAAEDPGSPGPGGPDAAPPGGDDGPDRGDDDDRGDGGQPGPGGTGPGSVPGRARGPGLPSLVNLTFPLATLAGLADRPGEVPGYGSADAGLVRDLAAAAAASSRTRYCLTLTDENGHAAGHACARRIRGSGSPAGRGGAGPGPGGWDLRPDPGRDGPGGGLGAWLLTVPGGARYRLDVHRIPLHDCDHRLETGSYRPGALLRHLVEVRDGECVSPSCSHPASSSDYEHAVPWDQGGRTDGCNAGMVSRRCHQVKQSRGWDLSNPEPGRHLWRTPSGRTYEKGPKSYPS